MVPANAAGYSMLLQQTSRPVPPCSTAVLAAAARYCTPRDQRRSTQQRNPAASRDTTRRHHATQHRSAVRPSEAAEAARCRVPPTTPRTQVARVYML
jgi:hypothetical protein